MDCLFCQIVSQDIPNHTVYEDAAVLAFLDIYPATKGHTVVIPKVHAETVLDLADEPLAALLSATRKTMQRLQQVLDPDGFNVGWNHGEAGGQAVSHLHLHIFPRWQGDGGGSVHSIVKTTPEISVAEVAKLFLESESR